MLRDISSWEDFLEPSITDYASYPRQQLKYGKRDVKNRLSKEIQSFCIKNFQGITDTKLAKLYDEVVAYRGIEIPLKEFESKYGKVNPSVIRGNPSHLTIHISLWGLQYLFPEDMLAKDLTVALEILQQSEQDLLKFKNKSHSQLSSLKSEISAGIRQKEFAQRSIILCSFNLMEAFLNGIAWDYCQHNDISELSKRKQGLLTDSASASIRDKLLKYPQIVCNSETTHNEMSELFLDIIKPFRDSLVHPSPFSAPERFGGYDKLRKIYDLDTKVTIQAVTLLCEIIKNIYEKINGPGKKPVWIKELCRAIENYEKLQLTISST